MNKAPGEDALRAVVARRAVARRAWLRLSQAELAAKARLSRNQISAIEHGRTTLDLARLLLHADALGVTLDWLIHGPDDQLTAATPGRSPRTGHGASP